MQKKRRMRTLAFVFVGALILVGAAYSTAALATNGPSTAAPDTGSTAGEDLRSSVLEMIEDHMGLTGEQAETWADEMLERMQSIDPDFDFDAMIERCDEFVDGAGCGGQGYGPGNCGAFDGNKETEGGNGSCGMGGRGYGMMGSPGLWQS